MSKQPPPAPTARAVGPCPTLIQTSRTPRHWKFTQDHRTTRLPPPMESIKNNEGLTGLNFWTDFLKVNQREKILENRKITFPVVEKSILYQETQRDRRV